MGNEVKLPSGKTVRICGMPIGHSDEQLRARFPELMKALDDGDAGALADAVIVMSGNLIDKKDCWVDEYSYAEIERIFFGSAYEKIKKKDWPSVRRYVRACYRVRWHHDPPDSLTLQEYQDLCLVDMGNGKVACFDGFCGTVPEMKENTDMKDLDAALRAMNGC